MLKNALIIHKKTQNKLCLMSVFISHDKGHKDTAKLYVQFFKTIITPNLNISVRRS